MRTLVWFFLLLGVVSAGEAWAQRQAGARPAIQAVALAEAPALDGIVATDAAWADVPVATGFTQTTPDDGQPATQRTEVRIGFTDQALYLGVILHDTHPNRIITADSRRDASMGDSDSFRFILDTFADAQNGFVFGTNAAGAEYDAQLVGSSGGGGFGGRMSGGSGGGLNVNWDASWEVRTAITETGWSAEFEIPFSTLRFPRGRTQVWGINFQRTIRRNNEEAYWAPLERQFSLTRVTHAGRLTDLIVPDPRNLKILPYVLGRTQADFVADDTDTKGDAGVDLKYSITPSLTLDATYNTDFAQVEVDEQQINLDRFSLFFPEKRPFFLENAGIFSVGDAGEAEVFFSRRIGIAEDRSTVPILGGARISGSVGAYKVGVLNMQTEEVAADAIPGTNFAVGRLLREFPNRSALGVMVTNRQNFGDFVTGTQYNDYNRVAAVDGRLGVGEYGTVSGFLAHSWTPGLDGNALAGQFSARYSDETYLIWGSYTEVGEAFNPEVGFLRREDYRKLFGLFFVTLRPENRFGFQELRPHTSYRGYWGRDGFQQTGFWHIDNHWEFRSGYEVHTGINLTYEGVRTAFEISDGVEVPAGEYPHQEGQWVFQTPPSKPVRFEVQFVHGGFFGGDRISIIPELDVRVGEALTASFAYGHNDVDLPGGSFVARLFRARVSYSFTPRIYLQALGQYNNQSEQWSMNVRFGWLQQANTGLFLVYNSLSHVDGRLLDTFPGEIQNRGFIVKYTYLFDVFD